VITWVLSSIEALKSGHLPSGALLRLPVWKTTSDPVHDLSIEQVSHKPSVEMPLRMKDSWYPRRKGLFVFIHASNVY
jgi:hypothetical protein